MAARGQAKGLLSKVSDGPSGTVDGKAAGLTFLIGPYQAGPYVEGGYEIVVPVAVFRSLLVVSYNDEFGGQPAKVGDVTPTGDRT